MNEVIDEQCNNINYTLEEREKGKSKEKKKKKKEKNKEMPKR